MNIASPSLADFASFLIIIGVAVFAALACLFLSRSKLMNRHKHHHRRHRPKRKPNPTRAQTGGLPPRREEKKSDGATPTT